MKKNNNKNMENGREFLPSGQGHGEKEQEIKSYLEKKKEDGPEEDFLERPKEEGKGKKALLLIGAILLVIIAVSAYLSFNKGRQSFENSQVEVFVEAAEDIESGAEVSLTVGYKNDNPVDLKDSRMEISLPDNFTVTSSDKELTEEGDISYWKIGRISKNSTDKIRIYGKFIGEKGDDGNIKGVLKYTPANFNSEFQSAMEEMLTISSTPVEMTMRFPDGGVKNDVDTDISILLKNSSARSFGKAKVEVQLPKAFTFVSSEMEVLEKDEDENRYIFEISDFSPEKEVVIAIKGNFHSESEKESVKASVYLTEGEEDFVKYLEKTEEVVITRPGISVVETINGAEDYVAGKNEELTYKIEFENQSDKNISGLTLRSVLTGNYDLPTIKADKGTVKSNEIVWSAAKVPALAQLGPGEKGEVIFRVKAKDLFTIEKESDKNFVLDNKVTMSTSQQEIISLTKSTKVRAFMVLETKGYFNDDGRIENGGSLPPKVGEKTYYTIHWSIRNLFNEVKNVRIKSVLPAGVKWTGKYIDSKGKVMTDNREEEDMETETGDDREKEESGEETLDEIAAESLYYDKDSNAVVWELPSLKANDGILTSAKEIVFQVEVEPREENAGKAMDIIDNITAQGYDMFAEQNVTNSGKKVTTELFDDYSISTEQAIVIGKEDEEDQE
jgi:hypothetical protein